MWKDAGAFEDQGAVSRYAVAIDDFVVNGDAETRAGGDGDVAVFEREAFVGELLVEGGFLDAVLEEVGAWHGGEEME